MEERRWEVGMCGTFDVANYGDLLFPLIAESELTERLGRAWPQGRWGSPEDAASVVMWLASDEAAWVTGQVINAEGGFRRWTD